MKKVIDFLDELTLNNDKAWFEANKPRYKEAEAEFAAFVEQLIEEIARFDDSVKGNTVKSCTYRIYRDVRFSKNKSPYKNHMGAYISPKGKNAGYAGYYFHIEGKGAQYIGGHLLAGGLHCPEKPSLDSVREEIFDRPQEFLSTLSAAEGFSLEGEKLKRVPLGFPADFEWAEYLKFKEYSLIMRMTDKEVLSKNLLEFTLEHFRKLTPFNHLLNRAIDYAKENNK